MKILVADDDDIALAIARKTLEKERHEVVVAHDGREAFEILGNSDIRVVISDWNMPHMDGIQLCQRIRATASLGCIYIIMVTSRNTKDEMLAGLWMGADDFITKPFEPMELLVRIRNAERLLATETTSVTIFALAKLAAAKNAETGGHLERMRAYCQVLAEQLLNDAVWADALPPRFPELPLPDQPAA